MLAGTSSLMRMWWGKVPECLIKLVRLRKRNSNYRSVRWEDIKADYIEDSSGEDSLEVWVILSDSTPDEELTGESVVQNKSAISESLLNSGVDLFPYIRFTKRADYDGDEELE